MKNFIAQLTYQKILAVIFLLLIFYIGAATLPQALETAGQALQTPESTLVHLRNALDASYRDMLTVEAEPKLQNKGTFIDLNGKMARAMGQRMMNNLVKLDNGHLIGMMAETDVTQAGEQITALCRRQKEKGKDFLFILAPYQVSKYDPGIPAGYEDFSNANSDRFLEILDKEGVPYLDLREKMHEQGILHADAYFTTDHHWTPATGFWAFQEIIKELAKKGAIEPVADKYTNAENYETRRISDAFLGAMGRRTGQYYAGLDQFDLITPNFESQISAQIPAEGIIKTGDFNTALLDESRLEPPESLFLSNYYGAYGNGDKGYVQYKNQSAPIDKKALFIGDSFGNAPFAFMTLCFQFCDELDMRYFDGIFTDYYDSYEPDILLLLINAGSINQENTQYDFFGEPPNSSAVSD